MAITSKSLKELSPRHQQLFERARSAYRANDPQSAVTILTDVVKEEPGCADARKALRAAQLDLIPERKGGFVGACRRFVQVGRIQMKGKSLLNGDKQEEALELAEDILAADPRSCPALMFLARVADRVGVFKAAEDALEFAVKFHPDNAGCWRALADHCLKVGHGRRALAALRQLRNFYPDDVELKAEINQAKAAAVMDVDSWEKVTAARDPVPEDPVAGAVDDESPRRDVQRAQNRAHRQKADTEKAGDEPAVAARVPTDDGRRRLKAQIMMKRRRQAAASATPTAVLKPSEGPLSEREYQQKLATFDGAIQQWQIYGRAHPDKQEDADREIADIRTSRHHLMRQHLEDVVRLKPDDLESRFELGTLVMEDQEWDYAIEQFQAARRNPDLKARSLANLGRSMAGKGLEDLAASQFEAALETGFGEDEQAMLSAKYDLAELYERLDRADEAAVLLKEIYAADINFRDVSFRVERLYAEDRKR